MRLEMLSPFRRWPNAPAPKAPFLAGDVYEADARAIGRRLQFAADQAVIVPGYASAVVVSLVRTPISLGGGKYKLVAKVKATALGYIYGFESDVALTNPALDALLNKAA
jgi:hypothetical protein